jgi:hypothetical protein
MNINFSLIPLIIALVFYLWYTFSIVYHLIRFGVGAEPKKTALVFFTGSFILFSLVIIAYFRINWEIIFSF